MQMANDTKKHKIKNGNEDNSYEFCQNTNEQHWIILKSNSFQIWWYPSS